MSYRNQNRSHFECVSTFRIPHGLHVMKHLMISSTPIAHIDLYSITARIHILLSIYSVGFYLTKMWFAALKTQLNVLLFIQRRMADKGSWILNKQYFTYRRRRCVEVRMRDEWKSVIKWISSYRYVRRGDFVFSQWYMCVALDVPIHCMSRNSSHTSDVLNGQNNICLSGTLFRFAMPFATVTAEHISHRLMIFGCYGLLTKYSIQGKNNYLNIKHCNLLKVSSWTWNDNFDGKKITTAIRLNSLVEGIYTENCHNIWYKLTQTPIKLGKIVQKEMVREGEEANKINDNECLTTNWHFGMKLDIHGANWAYIILSAMIWWVSECMRWHFVIYISGRCETREWQLCEAKGWMAESNFLLADGSCHFPFDSIDFHISLRQQSLFNAFKAHCIVLQCSMETQNNVSQHDSAETDSLKCN